MDSTSLDALLEAVAAGHVGPAEAAERLRVDPAEELGFATLDHHRALRDGLPEVVLAIGKTPAQVATIGERIFAQARRLLVTRIDDAQLHALREALPAIEHDEHGRCAWLDPNPLPACGSVAIVTAGTADLPAAEEAAITARMMGAQVTRHYDIGVAGLHRLLKQLPALRCANAIVVAAGMDGALPSVLGGLVANPVIALPTSIGYGAAFEGLGALLTMLNSCATGVSVVNIDNGFGAGYLAATINRLALTAP